MADEPKYLFTPDDIAALPEWRFQHQHNADAVRFTRPIGDIAGCEDMGVHIVRVPAGGQSSEFHFHEEDEEFVYVLSGRAAAEIGDEVHEVGPGDLMVFPKHSPAHMMRNPYEEELVFLVAGTRAPIDVCNYPRKGLRQYRLHGKREVVEADRVTPVTAVPEKVAPPKK